MGKKSSKIFENSFLKIGIWELWSEALIVSILSYPTKFYENRNFELLDLNHFKVSIPDSVGVNIKI